MILPCNCKHGYQDKTYGKGNRVHNVYIAGSNQMGRCTVCKTEKSANVKEAHAQLEAAKKSSKSKK